MRGSGACDLRSGRVATFNDRTKAINACTSELVSLAPNLGILPLTPFWIMAAIRASDFVTPCKSGPSSPCASRPWQWAQFCINRRYPSCANVPFGGTTSSAPLTAGAAGAAGPGWNIFQTAIASTSATQDEITPKMNPLSWGDGFIEHAPAAR